ncbi:G-type lectin S-receptor-like serine/threonine-protein kinase B120 isoform X1 [Hibiscus syriacus]|uniref:G-type lectin S-receptor-like serine/threonine-protein kinase B120 isoform X1 n=1 Tax=Hibiscus syriacus TaxID=106335 RepID=UPI0019235399|nr:G-type lectin S-receptor-like serine/threonine-protein kinase B120 isoform X1 [Hibiscus syriacus]
METCNKNPVFVSLVSLIFLLYSFAQFCHAANDKIRQGEALRDGETLVSENNVFELGFFSPGNSSFRYLGIWYEFDSEAVVWVANRDKPILGRNGVLRIEDDGKLVVHDRNDGVVWSSNVSRSSNNTAAKLSNDGNFMLSGDDGGSTLWESFNEPTDTFLPGMRVPVSCKRGECRHFRSWKSPGDPSPGNYSLCVDPNGGQQIVLWDNNNQRRWRSGQWNLQFFTGLPFMRDKANYLHGFDISRPDENGTMYITYTPLKHPKPSLFRFQISWEGWEKQSRWNASEKKWDYLHTEPDPDNQCELYNLCGNYSTCDRSRKCICLKGFRPKSQAQWDASNWSGGCVRKLELQCLSTNGAVGDGKPDGFLKIKSTKLPDLANLYPAALNPHNCKQNCSENCSCIAYAFIIGIGCMIWTGDLVDMQHFQDAGSLEFFYRLHHSELDPGRKISNLMIVIISLVLAGCLAASLWLLCRYKKKLKVSSRPCCMDDDVAVSDVSKIKSKEFSTDFFVPTDILIDGSQVNGPELQNFDFSYIATATKNFCDENRLGQGGFGTVYKGELPSGEQIAVKRLSVQSGQGLEEFKTEIILIAKLQHRNLVRLLGCCIHGDEKLLIYEYMPNKSLDRLLFDEAKKAELDWRTRLGIIEGIARGLLYLHRDSRHRIIHRDLKASNILLDAEMNPKISDFGMARMFGGNQNEAKTVRVVGTYGYMSPEYAMEGLFSVKSDAYSFGVLLLEIVSGQRNNSFRSFDHTSLLTYAWQLWSEDKIMDLVDPCIRDSCSPNEVLKCIHPAMLCVQDSPARRPKMETVVVFLESETATLPMPTKPTYTSLRTAVEEENVLDGQQVSSNHVTVTTIVGR